MHASAALKAAPIGVPWDALGAQWSCQKRARERKREIRREWEQVLWGYGVLTAILFVERGKVGGKGCRCTSWSSNQDGGK